MAGSGGGPGQQGVAYGFDELVPVDAFFDSYMAQLESVGASAVHQPHDCAGPASRQHAVLANMTAEADHYTTLLDAMDSTFDLHLDNTGETHGGDNIGGAISFNVADLAGLLEEPIEPLAAPVGQSVTAGQTPGGRVSTTGGNATTAELNAPLNHIVQTGYVSADASHIHASNAPKPAGSDHSHGGSVGHQATTSQDQGKGKRRRIRTEHQQEANKLAQKRYRERKKQKAAVLESTVEELEGRAEELARIKATNAGLQNTKAQLESELLEKEAHIRRLNEELQGSRLAGQRGASDANDDGSNSVNTGDLKGLWHAKMDEMRNVYDFNGLRNTKLSGEGVTEEVLGTMSMLVDEVVGIVHKLTRVEGLDLNELVNADPHGCDHLCDEQTKEIWTRVARQCELSQDQVAKVRVLRAEHLRKLEAIYNARQKLNLQTISVLLPSSSGGGAPSCMAGLFSRNRSNERMKRVLNELKENLKEEQRLAGELEFIVLNRLLMPLQAVSFMLEAYPCHCDCLALLNGAFQVYCDGKSGPNCGQDT